MSNPDNTYEEQLTWDDYPKDPQEWTNLASNPEHEGMKRELAQKWLPQEESPQVSSGRERYNIWDADSPKRKPKNALR